MSFEMASLGSVGKTSLDIYKSEATIAVSDCASLKCDTEQDPPQNCVKNSSEYVKRTIKQFEVSGNSNVCQEKQGVFVIDWPNNEESDLPQKSEKKPSYLGLACSVSGYSGITTYDSKLREGFRSREHSPGRIDLLKCRDTSPLSLMSVCESVKSHTLNVPQKVLYSGLGVSTNVDSSFTNSVTRTLNREATEPLISCTPLNQKEFERNKANLSTKSFENMSEHLKFSPEKLKSNCKNVQESNYVKEATSNYVSTINSSQSECYNFEASRNNMFSSGELSFDNGQDRPDCSSYGIPLLSNNNVNPVKILEQKQSPGTVRVVEFTAQKKSYVQTISTQSSASTDNAQIMVGSTIANGDSSKSFIQQRVERLYGRGALAQGFFKRMSLTPKVSDEVQAKESSSFTAGGSTPVLPVFRHLRPEFRAQLSLGSMLKHPEKGRAQMKPTISESECQPDLQPAAPEVVLPQPTLTESSEPVDSKCKDGHYFLKILKERIEHLNALVADAEDELGSGRELPEEALGKLRAASGQARLLIRQKLQQFEGLCQKNILQNSEEEFPTTPEDLEGFWDMVKLQIDHVDRLFEEIKQLRMNNWIEVKPISESNPVKRRSATTKRVNTKTLETNEAARKAREEARRKMMEERRRAMKQHKPAESIEIFVPQENGTPEVAVPNQLQQMENITEENL